MSLGYNSSKYVTEISISHQDKDQDQDCDKDNVPVTPPPSPNTENLTFSSEISTESLPEKSAKLSIENGGKTLPEKSAAETGSETPATKTTNSESKETVPAPTSQPAELSNNNVKSSVDPAKINGHTEDKLDTKPNSILALIFGCFGCRREGKEAAEPRDGKEIEKRK